MHGGERFAGAAKQQVDDGTNQRIFNLQQAIVANHVNRAREKVAAGRDTGNVVENGKLLERNQAQIEGSAQIKFQRGGYIQSELLVQRGQEARILVGEPAG